MAVPKRRHSTMRKGKRVKSKAEKLPSLVKCKHCGQPKKSHRVCKKCGK